MSPSVGFTSTRIKTPLTSQVAGLVASKPNSDMPRRLVEAPTERQRAIDRQTLGTLRSLTVQPATKARYTKAVTGFLQFLNREDLVLPEQRSKLDPLVCEYLEWLWATGKGRALACDTLAGLQDRDPKLKHLLPASWRLLKTWHVNEIPSRAPPLPEHILWAMVGWSLFHQHLSFGLSLLLGFYGMLRTGEILGLRGRHLQFHSNERQLLISLGFTKGGKRAGAAESIVIGHALPVHYALCWKRLACSTTPLTFSPPKWRKFFNDALEALKLTSYGFRPYSLRRGGATWWFSRHQNLDQIMIQGRWQAQKTARVYINEGLAVLAEMSLPPSLPCLSPFMAFFHKARTKRFTTLEPPPLRGGRAGGRGKNARQKASNRKNNVFSSAGCA